MESWVETCEWLRLYLCMVFICLSCFSLIMARLFPSSKIFWETSQSKFRWWANYSNSLSKMVVSTVATQKKVLGLNPDGAFCWVEFECSSHSHDMQISWIGNSKLTIGVNVSVNECVCVLVMWLNDPGCTLPHTNSNPMNAGKGSTSLWPWTGYIFSMH